MFDPESLMFQTDWKPIEDWFWRRAQEAVARGEITNIYQHTEKVSCASAIDPQIDEAARQLGKAIGRSINSMM